MVTAYFTTRHVYTSALRVVGMLRPPGGGAPMPFSMQCREPGRHPRWGSNPRAAAVTGAGGRQSAAGPRVAERIPYPPVRPSARPGRGSGSRKRPHRTYLHPAGPPGITHRPPRHNCAAHPETAPGTRTRGRPTDRPAAAIRGPFTAELDTRSRITEVRARRNGQARRRRNPHGGTPGVPAGHPESALPERTRPTRSPWPDRTRRRGKRTLPQQVRASVGKRQPQ